MGELGERLRQAREAKGLSLHAVEEATHIRSVFLQALEEERFADLPGDVYARGFVKTYANYLGLDAQDLLQRYRQAVGATSVEIPVILDEPLMHRSRSGRAFWLAVIVLLVGVLGWFAYDQLVTHRAGATLWPPELPFWRPSATPQATSTATPTVAPTYTPTPTPTEATATTIPSPTHTVPALTVATATPPPPTATPTGAPLSGEVAIVVEAIASAPTYLEVRLDGVTDYIGTLQAGQTRVWTAAERVELRIGNAGGLALRVNDVEVPPLGQPGQVLDVVYTPETLPTAP